MDSAGHADSRLSVEAYLLSENDSSRDMRHEYINGQVQAMAGASRGHHRIVGRFFMRLAAHLEGSGCDVFQSERS